jgi:hypothetical protein
LANGIGACQPLSSEWMETSKLSKVRAFIAIEALAFSGSIDSMLLPSVPFHRMLKKYRKITHHGAFVDSFDSSAIGYLFFHMALPINATILDFCSPRGADTGKHSMVGLEAHLHWKMNY